MRPKTIAVVHRPLQCFALCLPLQLVSSTSVGVPSYHYTEFVRPEESDWYSFIPTLTTVLSLR
jgi:hypothetical protein